MCAVMDTRIPEDTAPNLDDCVLVADYIEQGRGR